MSTFNGLAGRSAASGTADPRIELSFAEARRIAAQQQSRHVLLVRPDLSLLRIPCPVAGSMPRQVVDRIEAILSSARPRSVAVIAPTAFAAHIQSAEVGSPEWKTIGEAIPFFGLLSGLAYIGHSVCIFEGRSTEIAAGCRDADVLILDDGAAAGLTARSLESAQTAMRGRAIYVHERATFSLRPFSGETRPSHCWKETFDCARRATNNAGHRRIVFVQRDHSLLCLPCIPADSMTADELARAHGVIPAGTARNIAVMAASELKVDPSENGALVGKQLRAAGRAIPFFGLLLTLASAGNPLWIFDGPSDALVTGCRHADLLFIDSALGGELTPEWLTEVARVMRSANIVMYDRSSRKLVFVRKLGQAQDTLEFCDSQ